MMGYARLYILGIQDISSWGLNNPTHLIIMEAKQMEDQTKVKKSQWEWEKHEVEFAIRDGKMNLILLAEKLNKINEEIKNFKEST